MSTITANMPIPASTGNVSGTAREQSEATQFGELMKTQIAQNKESPDKEPKTGEHAADRKSNNAFMKGVSENWQMMNLLLIPGMPMPQILSENANILAAAGGITEPETMETLSAAPDITESIAGETNREATQRGQSDVVKMPAATDAELLKTETMKPDVDVFDIHKLKQTEGNAGANELPKDVLTGQAPQPILKNGQHKAEGMSAQKTAEVSSTVEKGTLSKENNPSEKESVTDKKQNGHFMQETGLRDNAAETAPAFANKAAEPPKTQRTDIRPEYLEQLKSNIADRLAAGKREFEIQLNPANLGKLIIKASYEAGRSVLSIVCSEAKTMETMSQQAGELAGMVEDRTGRHTIVVIEPPAADYPEQQGNQKDGYQQDHSEQNRDGNKEQKHHENLDFLQQLRLGLA